MKGDNNATMIAAEATTDGLDSLEERLLQLEKRLLGQAQRAPIEQTLITNLININNRLVAMLAGREKMQHVSRQVDQFERYIANPALLDRPDEDLAVRGELILQAEHRLRHEKEQLDQVLGKQKLLDSTAINNFDILTPKLNQLRLIAIEQFENNRKLNTETKKILSIYNEIMKTIKEQLHQWDMRLTLLEKKKLEAGNTSE